MRALQFRLQFRMTSSSGAKGLAQLLRNNFKASYDELSF